MNDSPTPSVTGITWSGTDFGSDATALAIPFAV